MEQRAKIKMIKMLREKYLQFVASALIALVLTIPFYISTYAAISSVSVKGSDGIEGFARATDFVNFNVQASLPNQTVASSNVIMGLGANLQFDSCAVSGNGSLCTLRFPSNGTDSFEPRAIPYTINLLRSDGTTDDSKSGTLTIDNKAPNVALSVPQGKFSSQQNVIVNYAATDFACDDTTCSGKCVGIKGIDFYTIDGLFRQTVQPVASSCNSTSSISIDPKVFNDGMNSVFAKATDNFNQVSQESSVTFEMDAAPPLIMPESFAISTKGVSLSTFSTIATDAEVSVNISGNDLDMNSVRADLSELNPGASLKNVKASCQSVDDNTTICKWAIRLSPGAAGLKNVVINASDTSGNRASATISKFLSIDEKGPVVLSLSVPGQSNGQLVGMASGNTVTASFDEASGLSPDEAFLHVDNSRIAAASCSKDTSWVCTWSNVNFGSVSTLSIQSDTTDVLGNPVTEDAQAVVKVDVNAPVLRSLNMSNVGATIQAFPGFFKIGDKIAVVANISEDNDVFATADFSKFISGASGVAGQCERIQADEHECTWLTDSINLQANDFVTFNFTDNAGNTLIVTRSLKTYGLENATVPDFWSSDVQCSPQALDRSLGTLINQREFCQVALTPKSTTKQVSTVFIGQASCSGDTSIVDNVETFNTEPGSTAPVIKITLRKGELRIDNASLRCSFDIFSKIGSGTDVTANPEIENANINLQFFNQPLGELSSDVNKKIKDAVDDANGIWKLIGTLNNLVTIAKKICQIMGVIYNLVFIFYSLTVTLSTAADICATSLGSVFSFLGFACKSLEVQKTDWCSKQQALREGAQQSWLVDNRFCKFVNCQWAPWVWDDYQKWIKGKIDEITPGSKYFPAPRPEYRLGGQGNVPVANDIKGGISAYMDPQHNLIVATLFACLPGIIYGLDKYRQIKCLYADCLQNAVGKDGLPVTSCEDLKAFSTCKYVYGELFALIPYTALLDHFLGILKNTLSNPFEIIGVGFATLCYYTCPVSPPASTGVYTACETVKLLSTMGNVIGNIKNIIDEGFKVRQDYCSRIKGISKSSGSSAKKLTSTGVQSGAVKK